MNVLIVDDEVSLRSQLIKYMTLEGINAKGAENGQKGIEMLEKESFDAVVVDLKMPVMDGLEMIKEAREMGFRMPIIMMSAHGETKDAVEAFKRGAGDYVIKPFSPDELTIRLKQCVETFRTKNYMEASLPKYKKLAEYIGECAEIKNIKEMIIRMGNSNSNVLITGESGTGKEVLARSIHATSIVARGPFVAINIAGIPENLIESELFGYEKGAFTGAVHRKPGLFELAQGGTLFLDEIGDASLSLQVKLLRVIQDKKITRLGGTQTIPINVRFIGATNKNLEEMIKEGTFREDLFFRLNVVHFHLPPLRERGDDVVLLSKNIVERFTRTRGLGIKGLTEDALLMLKSYKFPGNIRELENTLERATIFTNGDWIDAQTLEFSTAAGGGLSTKKEEAAEEKGGNKDILTMRDAEINVIKNALRVADNNRTKASEILGISRRSLISKIEEYNLD